MFHSTRRNGLRHDSVLVSKVFREFGLNMASSDLRPHVLAFPYPAAGHINPMILLCRKLCSMGFVVTFLNTRSSHEKYVKNKETGSDSAAGDSSSIRYMSIPDDCLPSGRMGNNIQMFLSAMEGMRPDFERILQQLMNDPSCPPVTCILCDAFIGWPQDVATKFGICRAAFWTTSATWAILSVQFPLLRRNGLLPVSDNLEKMVDFVPGIPPIPARFLPDTIQVEDGYDPGFKRRDHRNGVLRHDAWVLINSCRDLEPQQFDQLSKELPQFVPVGPLLPPDFFEQASSRFNEISTSPWSEDLSCLEWLDRQQPRSVVYISFGSLATLSFDQVEEILEGFERSGHAFLWVIRLDLLESDQERLDELLTKIRSNKKGLVISWAPQLKVLQHDSVAAFLTHCGWNSLTEAATAGVPLLCKPCFGDQVLNCALIVDKLKIGLRATEDDRGREVSRGRIEMVVKSMMSKEGCEMREKAKKLSEAVQRGIRKGGSSYANLEAFAEDMKKRQRKP